VARKRAYRRRWLGIVAVAVSAVVQSAVLAAFSYCQGPPQRFLTVRLDDAAARWIATSRTSETRTATSLQVVSASAAAEAGIAVAVAMPGFQSVGMAPQRLELPDKDARARIILVAPDGSVWLKTVDIKRHTETVLTIDYAPAQGQVLVTRSGDSAPLLRCTSPRCTLKLPPNTAVTLTAVLARDAVFGGFHQYPTRTPESLRPWLGDPLASCEVADPVKAATSGSIFDCAFSLRSNTEVLAEFSAKPTAIEVAFTDSQLDAVIKPLTTPDVRKRLAAQPRAPQPPPTVAMVPPAKAPQAEPVPPEQPKPAPEPSKQPPPNMTMVEVPNSDQVIDKAPEDAKFLSDKNRDVAQESRAEKTNLEKESTGEVAASKQSPDTTSREVGGPDDKIRQLEETAPTTDQRMKATDHSGTKETAAGEIRGEGGSRGEDGAGDQSAGVLSMRGVGGRGSIVDVLGDGKKRGKRGLPGVNSALSFSDYERILGKERVDEERQVAARKSSTTKGKWEKNLAAIRSSLENFVPDVRPGNQTALKTRAHPFAVYVARMHRRIHELWGFGFLEDLDSKAATYPLNNPDLWVNLEVSVNSDGTIHKVTIAKTSGKTEFDVAAIHTVIAAAPYDPTPEAIRSVDGRIYLHWGFYRNWRQCGTFNVEPYILNEVPDDGGKGALDDR
jgi:TonB family protein